MPYTSTDARITTALMQISTVPTEIVGAFLFIMQARSSLPPVEPLPRIIIPVPTPDKRPP